MTNSRDLVKVRSKALRTKVWFKALTKLERAIFNLTIKCVKKIQSPTLESALSHIVYKIVKALENRFLSKAEKTGRQLAEKLGNIAQEWGNKTASNWKRDKNFIIYLGVNNIN